MTFLHNLNNFLFPNTCILCATTENLGQQSICSRCCNELPWLESTCFSCAIPFQKTSDFTSIQQHANTHLYCADCLQNPPPFERCIAAFSYSYPVSQMIHHYKYHRHHRAGKVLAQLLGQIILKEYEKMFLPDCLTAVPLHWLRSVKRGFNQAAFIANDLSRQLNIPLLNICQRTRHTPYQKNADKHARKNNLQQAFSVSVKPVNKHIAIIDDVMTTGTTVKELALLLKQAGAKRVDIWVVARTPTIAL